MASHRDTGDTRPAPPNWRLIGRGVLLALLLSLGGVVLLLAGVTLIGAVVFGVGAGIVLFIPWFGVLASGVREPSDELPPETSIANSYFGFVFGLLSAQERKEPTRERDGRARD